MTQDKQQHTPGPWWAKLSSAAQGILSSETTGETVAVSYHPRDARLIAAAPDLLEACERLLRIAPDLWGKDAQEWPRIMDRIESSISKAKGE